jgi:hypothetical protein
MESEVVKHNSNDEVKEDEMSRAHSTHGEKRNACRKARKKETAKI